MSDTDQEQFAAVPPTEGDSTEGGFLHLEETADRPQEDTTSVASPPVAAAKPSIPLSPQARQREGTVEHLAARQTPSELKLDTPEMKQRLSALRSEFTRQVTGIRWENVGVEETADHMIPLLNVGPVQQWKDTLIPFLYEIDRGGALIPVWFEIIERGDPADLSPNANPAETMQGRARRFAILMLGNYRLMGVSQVGKIPRLTHTDRDTGDKQERNITQYLGYLATDPNTSLYATQSLVKHATMPALQALIGALKDAKGWAKVDVVEGCVALNQEQFYDLLVASGLDNVAGLESYVAIPIYRTVPLEQFLSAEGNASPRLTQQAALIFSQVLQESMTPPVGNTEGKPLPAVFERHLPAVAEALFAGARRKPMWQNTVAVHRLGLFLGRYWRDISQKSLTDGRIIDSVYHCLPMMNDVERWMDGPGRDVLLSTLADPTEKALTPVIKVLGELREPRATSLLIKRLEAVEPQDVSTRADALAIGTICDTLGQLGDLRATITLEQLIQRTVPLNERSRRATRGENLPTHDPDVPGSIVYAAAIRAIGTLGDRVTLETVLSAINDFDPYVRTQAIEALRRLDPSGEDARSRTAVRDALHDPRESVVRIACQLVVKYHDIDAVPTLRQMVETRSTFSNFAQDSLRQLGQ